jgi:hypothetical protein
MTDLVNVLDRKILGERTKKVPWIEGAKVTFLNDVPGNFTEQLEAKSKDKDIGATGAGYWSAMQTVIDWNFSGEDGKKLPVNEESLRKLPLKLQKWIFNQSAETMLTDEERKKG